MAMTEAARLHHQYTRRRQPLLQYTTTTTTALWLFLFPPAPPFLSPPAPRGGAPTGEHLLDAISEVYAYDEGVLIEATPEHLLLLRRPRPPRGDAVAGWY